MYGADFDMTGDRREIARLQAEVRKLRAGLKKLQHMHRRSDDDSAGPPYCPECQAYDGTGQPCETLRVVDELLGKGE